MIFNIILMRSSLLCRKRKKKIKAFGEIREKALGDGRVGAAAFALVQAFKDLPCAIV